MEVLELLESQSYNIFLCTGGSRASVQRVLQTNGVCKFFQDSICGDDVENGKPDPTILNNLIERNYLEKEDTLLIEDSENGYKCGKSAGVDTLIVFREDDFDCDLEFESLLDSMIILLSSLATRGQHENLLHHSCWLAVELD